MKLFSRKPKETLSSEVAKLIEVYTQVIERIDKLCEMYEGNTKKQEANQYLAYEDLPVSINDVVFRADTIVAGVCDDKGDIIIPSNTEIGVRPFNEKYGNKTYRGKVLCSILINVQFSVQEHDASKVLHILPQAYKPVIFIPEKETVIMGEDCLFYVLNSDDDFRDIEDSEIEYAKNIRKAQGFKHHYA